MERLKEIGFLLRSMLSPFGAVVVRPWPGTETAYEDISQGPPSTRVRSGEHGEIIIPNGSTAEVTFRRKGQEFNLEIKDYRKRAGHTPGAKISGEFMIFKIGPKAPQQKIPGIASFTYKKK